MLWPINNIEISRMLSNMALELMLLSTVKYGYVKSTPVMIAHQNPPLYIQTMMYMSAINSETKKPELLSFPSAYIQTNETESWALNGYMLLHNVEPQQYDATQFIWNDRRQLVNYRTNDIVGFESLYNGLYHRLVFGGTPLEWKVDVRYGQKDPEYTPGGAFSDYQLFTCSSAPLPRNYEIRLQQISQKDPLPDTGDCQIVTFLIAPWS